MPHFPLVTVGTVVGARELGRPDWPPGSVIYTGPEKPTSRVVRVLETEEDDPGDALLRVSAIADQVGCVVANGPDRCTDGRV